MSLRFSADHCIPRSVIQAILDSGHKVCLLRDHLPIEASDALVIKKAQEINAILLSLNGDFADIVTYPPGKYRGIMALQVRNHPKIIPNLMRRLKDFLLVNDSMGYFKGKLFIVEVNRIRVRE
ncbi:MAG: DUF5615 family PIN-like protein [Thermodesulfobacteriota bacterium]|nr:DUF5615 family PIN-like protein [Thermodesulfobacteriota bacterium]